MSPTPADNFRVLGQNGVSMCIDTGVVGCDIAHQVGSELRNCLVLGIVVLRTADYIVL
jgi:hypothetical protein